MSVDIIKGSLLLLLLHAIAAIIIFVIGLVALIFPGYVFIQVWYLGAKGLLFWQLLYVIPLVRWLNHRHESSLVQGVVLCAGVTALINIIVWLRT
ncbi:MAG: hypothetical protein AAF821_02550 [Cyanobacteria bacterium P01_D01_bin.156]